MRSHFLLLSASIRDRSCCPKAGMLETVDSKSKSKPSTTLVPNGRGDDELDEEGPKIDQMLLAAVTAAEDELKPPSVYVAPPMESRIVLP